ncbi:MAG TPA: hypothetical protein PKW33_10295 [Anaerolineaceae bacterium]|nr:hypothetical protein [Anaerolineaceae bacterium]HPN51966.1 hypothetical protein [Anaerolineaceae bacterium]
MKKQVSKKIGMILTVLLLTILMTSSLAWAMPATQERTPEPEADVQARSSYIPVQGRLTDNNGTPLNGMYNLTIKLYGDFAGGTALCSDTISNVSVTNGLFSTAFSASACPIDGRQLYMGITVDTDAEMTPRMYIDNVPYAWSLRPGAEMKYSLGTNAILDIENSASNGRGLRAYATSPTGKNYGVVGASESPDGYGGYFYNTATGTALYAQSDGVALQANGKIASSEPSYLWISGNDLRAFNQTDKTTFNMNSRGGVRITAGVGGATTIDLVLPITIMGTQYGQNAKITELRFFWKGQTSFDSIINIRLRRQVAVCDTLHTCYEDILYDSADYTCDSAQVENASGCTYSHTLTNYNTLSADSGIIYLNINIAFSGDTTWVDFDGARLTLEYGD